MIRAKSNAARPSEDPSAKGEPNPGAASQRVTAFSPRRGSGASAVEIYRHMLDALPEHAAVLDERGTVLALNRAWRHCAPSACFHPPEFGAGDDYLHESGRRLAEGFHSVVRGEREAFRVTNRHLCGNRYAWFRVSVTRIAGDGPVRLLAIHEDVTRARAAEKTLAELTERLLSSQDEERRRIARDLHDVTAQNIVAMSMSLARLEENPTLHEKARTVLGECRALAEESLREIRTLSYLLHPPLLDELGLVSAIRWFVGGFASRSGVRVDVAELGDPGRLPSTCEVALYHVLQESLRNVYRHSGSATASVALGREDGRVVLRIADRGCGIPAAACDACGESEMGAGVGIASMRHRVRQAGGTLEIVSCSTGTTVAAAVPAPNLVALRQPSAPRRGSIRREIPNMLDS